jgi:VWFA-related protein
MNITLDRAESREPLLEMNRLRQQEDGKMVRRRIWLCRLALLVLLLCTDSTSHAQDNQQQAVPAPTLRVTSNLVILDVTVLDKKGSPVVSGLTKDDFSITEDRKPQHVFSFEAPDAHTLSPNTSDEGNSNGKVPVAILVLDLLNSRFEDFAYIRYSVRKYLLAQPDQLTAPTEMLVVGNNSLDMLEGYTRSRSDLLYALDHLPAALPFKMMSGEFCEERFNQSIDALQQIALQNKGVPGRKNIIWVGHGGPNLDLSSLQICKFGFTPKTAEKVSEYVHMTTNMLVDARISLFVIHPGLPDFSLSTRDANLTIGDYDPFAGDINFGMLSNETGGKLFYNRNDVDKEMAQSAQLGSNYYTLTYQPEHVDPNGKFRHVRVTLRDSSPCIVTKAGYYAPDDKAMIKPGQQHMIKLAEALQASFPINSLDVNTGAILRHPDAKSVQITILIRSKNLDFLPDESGKNSDHLFIAAASLDGSRRLLAWRIQRGRLETATTDPSKLPYVAAEIPITVPFPRKAKTVRIVIEDENGGRIGSAEIDKGFIDNAPEAPTPNPELVPRSSAPRRVKGASVQ